MRKYSVILMFTLVFSSCEVATGVLKAGITGGVITALMVLVVFLVILGRKSR